LDITRPAVSEPVTPEAKPAIKASLGYHGFKPMLRFKLLFLIGSIVLVSVMISSFTLIYFQRLQLIQNAQTSTQVLSNTLEADLQHAMLSNDWSMAKDVIQRVAEEKTIDSIRLLDANGIIGISSLPNELGKRLDRSDPTCQLCHAAKSPNSSKTVILSKGPGKQDLLNVNLIENKAECHACHSSATPILGLLMIETPMTSLNEQLSRIFVQTILLGIGTLVMLTGLIALVLNRYVVQPVEEISKGVAEISSGNLDYQVRVDNRDELSALATSFDTMREQLKASQLEMESRNRELSVINEVGLTIGQSLDLREVLDVALETVTEKLNMEVGLIFLRDEVSDRLILCASRGASIELCQEIERRRSTPTGDISGIVAKTERTFFLIDLSHDPRLQGLWDHLESRSYLNVPLRSKGKVVGAMGLVSFAGKPATEPIVAILESVGNQIGMVVENAQLYQRLRFLSVLEERDRLARELHDDLAQALGYLNVKASITNELLVSGSIDQARESLSELKGVAKFIYTDVREAIFNLRTTVSSRLGLIPTLHEYIEEYKAHYNLDVQLLVDCPDGGELPPEVANQLLRVIQEALINVRKHAAASKVFVQYRQNPHLIFISVEDDGKGFTPTPEITPNRQHIGLQVMRERVEGIGGSLELVSQPGQGTRVVVQVPL
jgi:nitrate/nitrite-specific signal transduction histidine kinase